MIETAQVMAVSLCAGSIQSMDCRMKVAIAIDSFKGRLTSCEAGRAVTDGIDAFFPALRETATLEKGGAAAGLAASAAVPATVHLPGF